MYSLLLLAAVSFTICFLLTPLIRNLLCRFGVVDHPDGDRKTHPIPIPRLGGIPIALAVVSSLFVFDLLPSWGSRVLDSAIHQIQPLLPAAAFVFLIGVLDDLYSLRPWEKLAGQFLAATWIYLAGLRVETIGETSLSNSHWLLFPVTIVWLIGCTNAFNLIDGVDGLASGVGFFATSTMLVAAILQGSLELQILTISLAAALLAFLRYNFNPASIFLGDSGSLLIGFLLGCYAIIWSQKSATILGMTAPVLALGFPIAETLISIVRRYLRGDPIFAADRGHIHHRLLEKGLRPRQVAVVIYAITGICAAVSLIVADPEIREKGVIVILFCLLSWVGFQHLGYTEFVSARRILFGGTVRRLLAADIRVRNYTAAMDQARSLNECWMLTVAALRDLEFDHVELDLPADERHPRLHREERLHPAREDTLPEDRWTLRVPIPNSNEGYVSFSRHLDRGEGYLVIHPVVEALRRVLPRHIHEHHQQALQKIPDAARERRGPADSARTAEAGA